MKREAIVRNEPLMTKKNKNLPLSNNCLTLGLFETGLSTRPNELIKSRPLSFEYVRFRSKLKKSAHTHTHTQSHYLQSIRSEWTRLILTERFEASAARENAMKEWAAEPCCCSRGGWCAWWRRCASAGLKQTLSQLFLVYLLTY
ncbi:hypothetical protein BpHYR1_031242 [Brachionus plicatilis]|uniref:Uncharacterized protein n=1 Tax=Brachionus plicatilis TaxID=10195 RepID=A0A3M7RZY2_BRAPC|nr:hypothetical protein BpHYR1_031242 [Brachionus plicatilis]